MGWFTSSCNNFWLSRCIQFTRYPHVCVYAMPFCIKKKTLLDVCSLATFIYPAMQLISTNYYTNMLIVGLLSNTQLSLFLSCKFFFSSEDVLKKFDKTSNRFLLHFFVVFVCLIRFVYAHISWVYHRFH